MIAFAQGALLALVPMLLVVVLLGRRREGAARADAAQGRARR
jgi:hypothetical protein